MVVFQSATPSNGIAVSVIATDLNNCKGYDTITLRVFSSLPEIYVPTAFAPQGANRVLRAIPVGVTLKSFIVFDRWGKKVYQTNEQNDIGWNGNNYPSGVYVWVAEGTDYTGKTIQRKGSAMLIR